MKTRYNAKELKDMSTEKFLKFMIAWCNDEVGYVAMNKNVVICGGRETNSSLDEKTYIQKYFA